MGFPKTPNTEAGWMISMMRLELPMNKLRNTTAYTAPTPMTAWKNKGVSSEEGSDSCCVRVS